MDMGYSLLLNTSDLKNTRISCYESNEIITMKNHEPNTNVVKIKFSTILKKIKEPIFANNVFYSILFNVYCVIFSKFLFYSGMKRGVLVVFGNKYYLH